MTHFYKKANFESLHQGFKNQNLINFLKNFGFTKKKNMPMYCLSLPTSKPTTHNYF